ncbi:MAG TPA: EutN/CcmL family microcompartment protein [Armatimonadota bacterium]|jgi:ethanolamine utilization protein EutN|nr:EutN/CcmL family microcompartment protein [Armatimonadota bacterium]
MFFAKVIGKVVSTVKDEGAHGKKLLLVQPTDHELQPAGDPLVAFDAVGCGVGETVFAETGREAGVAWDGPEISADATIVGIIDRIDATSV